MNEYATPPAHAGAEPALATDSPAGRSAGAAVNGAPASAKPAGKDRERHRRRRRSVAASTMAALQRFGIGGLGALAPGAVNLLATDFETVLVKSTIVILVGYVVRTVLLFCLGGFVASLHRDEKAPLKLFQLGIAAPAIIISLLNASHVERAAPASPVSPAIALGLASVAYAQSVPALDYGLTSPTTTTTATTTLPKQFQPLPESLVDQFWRGVSGSPPTRVWFVIAGTYSTLPEAEEGLARLAAQPLSPVGFLVAEPLRADVYEPSGGFKSYAVVLGANLTLADAEALRAQAVAAGWPAATTLWRLAV